MARAPLCLAAFVSSSAAQKYAMVSMAASGRCGSAVRTSTGMALCDASVASAASSPESRTGGWMPRARSRTSAMACLAVACAVSSNACACPGSPPSASFSLARPTFIASATRRAWVPSCRSRSMRRSVVAASSTATARECSSSATRASRVGRTDQDAHRTAVESTNAARHPRCREQQQRAGEREPGDAAGCVDEVAVAEVATAVALAVRACLTGQERAPDRVAQGTEPVHPEHRGDDERGDAERELQQQVEPRAPGGAVAQGGLDEAEHTRLAPERRRRRNIAAGEPVRQRSDPRAEVARGETCDGKQRQPDEGDHQPGADGQRGHGEGEAGDAERQPEHRVEQLAPGAAAPEHGEGGGQVRAHPRQLGRRRGRRHGAVRGMLVVCMDKGPGNPARRRWSHLPSCRSG